MGKRQRLRPIFESVIASTPQEKKAACQEAIEHLVTYFGLDEQAASQFILEQELPHALAHDGPGQIVLRTDIANPEGAIFPFYRPLDWEKLDREVQNRIILAPEGQMSPADHNLLRRR